MGLEPKPETYDTLLSCFVSAGKWKRCIEVRYKVVCVGLLFSDSFYFSYMHFISFWFLIL